MIREVFVDNLYLLSSGHALAENRVCPVFRFSFDEIEVSKKIEE